MLGTKKDKWFSSLQMAVDAVLIYACWLGAYFVRFNFFRHGQSGLDSLFYKFGIVLVLLSLYFYRKENLYKSQRFSSRMYEILAVVKANSFSTFSFVFLIYFVADDRLSRLTLLLYFGLSTFTLTLARLLMRNLLRYLRAKGHNLKHLVLIGDGRQLESFIQTALSFKDAGIRFSHWIDASPEQKRNFIKINHTTEELSRLVANSRPDGIVVSYSALSTGKLDSLLKDLYDSLIPVQVLPDLSFSFIGHKIEDFAGIPYMAVNQPGLKTIDHFIKRLIDFTGALIGLLILSPLLLLLSILTKLSSPGPVFYGQERVGLDGNNFIMWKFRTMRLAAADEDKNQWGSKDNPRKTAFGTLLRRTSLDELPQLWNVLIGDMSLIGPRPERPFFVDQFRKEIPAYMLRHKMKAGITGWAQINGLRGDTSIPKRIQYDIYYIKNWSLWLDVKILFLTLWKGFFNKNAY
jgi:exopolysaccharide biosynthesis polyprenyl glycosylphosphotransferase